MSGGLLGLTYRGDRRQQVQNDKNTLMQMYQMKRQEDAENQAAILAEQEVYDQINQQTFQLLEGDRADINKKAKYFQEQIKKKIRLYGNNRGEFMKNGGTKMLMDYKNKMIGSDQFMRYKNNKINMERILALKEKDLGGRMTEQDMLNLQHYEKYGQGEITYNGLLNDIKVDRTLYDYDHDITPQELMNEEGNRVKLISNMLQENYRNKTVEEISDSDIVDYIKKKGYGGKGKNTTAMTAKAKGGSGSSPKVYNSTTFIAGQYELNQTNKDMTLSDFTAKDAFSNIIDDGFTMDKNNHIGVNSYAREGFWNDKFRVVGNIFGTSKMGYDLVEQQEGKDHFNEEGKYIPDLHASNIYDVQGENSPETKTIINDLNEGFTIGEPMLAFKAKINGKNIIKVEKVNSKGELDDDKETYGDGRSKATGEITTVVKITSPNRHGVEQTYYLEIDTTSRNGKNNLQLSMGKSDDISKTTKSEQAVIKAMKTETARLAKITAPQSSKANEQGNYVLDIINQNEKLRTKYDSYLKSEYTDSKGNNRSPLMNAMMLSMAINHNEQHGTDINQTINNGIDNDVIGKIFEQFDYTYKAQDLNIPDIELITSLNKKAIISQENENLSKDELNQIHGYVSLLRYTVPILEATYKRQK